MTHFTARTALRLAVKMQAGLRLASEILPVCRLIAQKIGHDHVAVALRASERPAGDSPDMLLELRNNAGIHGPVAGIVDAGSDFVDDQPFSAPLAGQEQFYPDDADIIEGVR